MANNLDSKTYVVRFPNNLKELGSLKEHDVPRETGKFCFLIHILSVSFP